MSIEERGREGVVIADLREAVAGASGPIAGRDRYARVLAATGSMRVTVVTLAPGAGLSPHRAPGSITIQPLRGRITFSAEGRSHELEAGALVVAEAGIEHAVASDQGASFLLTVCA